MTDSPEPRSERVTVAVTEREKRAVKLLALLDDTTETDVLRAYALNDIVRLADERRARLDEAA